MSETCCRGQNQAAVCPTCLFVDSVTFQWPWIPRSVQGSARVSDFSKRSNVALPHMAVVKTSAIASKKVGSNRIKVLRMSGRLVVCDSSAVGFPPSVARNGQPRVCWSVFPATFLVEALPKCRTGKLQKSEIKCNILRACSAGPDYLRRRIRTFTSVNLRFASRHRVVEAAPPCLLVSRISMLIF